MAIYNENGVPLLHNLSSESLDRVAKAHGKAVAAVEEAAVAAGTDPDSKEAHASREAQSKHLYLGESVLVHNKAPVGGGNIQGADGTVIAAPDGPQYTAFVIGASTLQEALTEVVGAFDAVHLQTSDHIDPPDWVASTNEDLASLLAEHYGAEVRDISEVI